MSRRTFRRASEEGRRQDLIQATLDCVAEKGLKGATVREIAERAGVTNGLIRHYFDGKDQMVQAAYRATMSGMTRRAVSTITGIADPHERLRVFVEANLRPPIVDARTLSLWASFIGLIHVDPAMAAIHRQGYLEFRNEVERLIGDLYAARNRSAAPGECRLLAIKVNAVIDGLWLEGCLASEIFASGELAALGIDAVEDILGVTLAAEGASAISA